MTSAAERPALATMPGDEFVERAARLTHAREGAEGDATFGLVAEESLDNAWARGTDGREVQMEAEMAGQPFFCVWMLVSRTVGGDQALRQVFGAPLSRRAVPQCLDAAFLMKATPPKRTPPLIQMDDRCDHFVVLVLCSEQDDAGPLFHLGCHSRALGKRL